MAEFSAAIIAERDGVLGWSLGAVGGASTYDLDK